MTSAKNPADPEESSRPHREPLTPAKRKRLQQIFERGSQMMAQDNFDYATELLAQCVIGDPSNLSYLQSYIGNLQKKYNNNKTGSKLAQFKERGSRSALKKAVAQSKWDEAIPHGLKVLAVNPWDVAALTGLATAAGNAGDNEPEMFYLKCALNVNSKDADVNRQCALALSERQQFDQAIACWHRVQLARPGDEEAQRAIANLAVEKTIVMGKFDDADETKKLGGHHSAPPKAPEREVSFEERLRQQIQRNPRDMPSYHELAQIYLNAENYQAAEEVYASAFKVSDGDADIRERWEDVQIRHLRKQISLAQDEPTKEKLRKQYHEKNLAYCRSMCQRYPNNPLLRYDLGISLYDNKEYNEAIKELQAAKTDPRRKGDCLLALGKCFQKIKQYRLAITHYEAAIAEIPDREADSKRDTLYRAGKLALALNDMDAAEKHLTYLAGLDFAYKDVSELLDKIAQTRENKGLDS